MEQMKIQYKIYLEAEDISQPRIQSSIAFVKNMLQGCRNVYFKSAALDDESSLDEFALRLYIENDIQEAPCSSPEDAESFVLDMAEFLDAIAAAHSYMDMEGSFTWEYGGRQKAYQFHSESGLGYCEMEELP